MDAELVNIQPVRKLGVGGLFAVSCVHMPSIWNNHASNFAKLNCLWCVMTGCLWSIVFKADPSLSVHKGHLTPYGLKLNEASLLYQRHLQLLNIIVECAVWWQVITNEVLYAGLPKISTTMRERRHRFSSYCLRSKNEPVSDLVLWELKNG